MIAALIAELVRIGFSDKEASVYVLALERGKTTAQEIADAAGLARASTYDVLEALSRKGLVTPYAVDGQRRYLAEPPERVLSILHGERRAVDERISELELLLPKLSAIRNAQDEKPRIRYVEGFDGLRTMQREFESSDGDIIQLVGYDAFLALHDISSTRTHRKAIARTDRNVRSIIVTDRKVNFADVPSATARVVPPSVITAAGEMSVCEDRVLLLSYQGGLIAIEIRSQAIADACRATLELAWREAGRIEATMRGTMYDEVERDGANDNIAFPKKIASKK